MSFLTCRSPERTHFGFIVLLFSAFLVLPSPAFLPPAHSGVSARARAGSRNHVSDEDGAGQGTELLSDKGWLAERRLRGPRGTEAANSRSSYFRRKQRGQLRDFVAGCDFLAATPRAQATVEKQVHGGFTKVRTSVHQQRTVTGENICKPCI